MKFLSSLLLTLVLSSSLVLQAKDKTEAKPYFDASAVNLKALLPDPPADGSPETLKEIDLILEKQKARTPEEVARIKRAVKLDVYLFDTVLGDSFKAKNIPVTAALFERVDVTEHPIVSSAKNFWNRPRPPQQDKRVMPAIDLPKNSSYPSGHSTAGYLNALILSELVPDLKKEIMARGEQIGDDRIAGGVHFPSDVAAGRVLAKDIFTKLMANADFQADLAKAKIEMSALRAKN